MNRVTVVRNAITHYQATCTVCDFYRAASSADGGERARIRRAIYRHVSKTGHVVILEKGTVVKYAPGYSS